ncbi:hypothetical protein [Rhizobacter sp. SG703]|uniref:hypothetical protein n=1 Tax=Rhizobacter sp. SG703 TaxID=2587140 RepID=UPI001446681F|nr:hypothetical protein [Rhizobacter sp. SG703]NKI92802.1 hypothetical protein [Rhizobacter sp. SG703]
MQKKFDDARSYGDLHGLMALKVDMCKCLDSPTLQAVKLTVDWLNSLWEVYKANFYGRHDIFCEICDLMQVGGACSLTRNLSTAQFKNLGELLLAIRDCAEGVQLENMQDLLTRFCRAPRDNAEYESLVDNNFVGDHDGSSLLEGKMRDAVGGSDPFVVIRIGRQVVESDMAPCEKLSILNQMNCIQWDESRVYGGKLVSSEYCRLTSAVKELIHSSNQAPKNIELVPDASPIKVAHNFDYFRNRMNSSFSRTKAADALNVMQEIINSNLDFEDKYDILYSTGVGVLDPEVELQNFPKELTEFKKIRDDWLSSL